MGKKKEKEPAEPEMPVDEDGYPIDDIAIGQLQETIVGEMMEELVMDEALAIREKRRQEVTAPYSAALLINDCLRIGRWYAMARDEGNPEAGMRVHEAWTLEVSFGSFGHAVPLIAHLTRHLPHPLQEEPITGKPDAWARGAVPTRPKKKALDTFSELEHMKTNMTRCVRAGVSSSSLACFKTHPRPPNHTFVALDHSRLTRSLLVVDTRVVEAHAAASAQVAPLLLSLLLCSL